MLCGADVSTGYRLEAPPLIYISISIIGYEMFPFSFREGPALVKEIFPVCFFKIVRNVQK